MNDGIVNILKDPEIQRMINAPDFITKNAERDLVEALHDQDPHTPWAHDGDLAYIPDYIVWCAKAWDPQARLLGNARAGDIANAVTELTAERDRLKALLANSIGLVDELLAYKESGARVIAEISEGSVEDYEAEKDIRAQIAHCEKYLASVREALK